MKKIVGIMALWLISFLLFLCMNVWATTYYVASGEALSKYDSVLKAGDIVIVGPGSYGGVNPKISGITYKSLEPLGAKTGQWYFSRGVSNVIIDGFDITNNGPLHENANCDNIMRNCWIHDVYIGWDVTGGSHRNIAENCKFERCTSYAFHTSGANNIGNIIRNCEIYDCGNDGINISPAATGTQVLNNIVANCGDSGIHCFGASSIIKGNLVYGNRARIDGVALWAAGGNTIVENNTVVGEDGTTYNVLFWLEQGGNRVYNNIFYVDSPNEKLFFSEGSGDIDYNCWYNPRNPMSPIGSHGIAVDPKFVDIGNNDYRLRADSPCIGTGENGVDMGAYGYTEPQPSIPVIGEMAVRNRPNPFRAGKEVTWIEYNLNQPSNVTITIYDLLGQEVWHKSYPAGEEGGKKDSNSVPWDGRNLSGEVVGNGGYICRIWIERENRHVVRKIGVAK